MSELHPQPSQPTPSLTLIPERAALVAGGRSDALLRLFVEATDDAHSSKRKPLTLSLVIDRSGSMSGAPLAYAKAAALHALTMLQPGDAVAVVSFESHVEVVVPTTLIDGDLEGIRLAIATIESGGSTALHAGWVEGLTQALMFPREAGFARVILLSDGRANVGLRGRQPIAAQVAQALQDTGVTTSAMGIANHFDEHLMRAIADAGAGSYSFVNDPSELAELFETEFVSIAGLRGRNLRLSFSDTSAEFVAVAAGARVDGAALLLPDLVVGMPRELMVTFVAHGPTLPPLRLEFDDERSGQRVALVVAHELPFVELADWSALPVAAELVEARYQQRFSAAIAEFEGAVVQRDFAAAAQLVEALRAEVAGWPHNPRRVAQLSDLDAMLDAIRQHDDLRAQKLTHRERYEAELGFGRFERKQMLDADRSRRGANGASLRAAVPPPLPHFEVQGPNGRHRLEVVVGNLTHERVDAVVNPSNRGLFGTAGVDGAVHASGGPELTAACRQIGGIQYGEAVFTPGFRLPAKHVIHIATMAWVDGNSGELDSLRQGYVSALVLAGRLRCQSVTFPAIGTGTYRFPFNLATATAIGTVVEMLQRHGGPERVRFIVRQPQLAERYQRLLAERLVGGVAHATRSIS